MSHAKPMTDQEVEHMRGLEPREFLAEAISDCKIQSDPRIASKHARKVDLFVRAIHPSGEVKLYTSPKECVEFLELAARALESGEYQALTDNRSSSYDRTYARKKTCKLRTTILEFETYREVGESKKTDVKYFVSMTTPTVFDDPGLEIDPKDLK